MVLQRCPDGSLKKRRNDYKAKGFPTRCNPEVPIVNISWKSPTILVVVS